MVSTPYCPNVALGGAAHEQQVPHRQGPHDVPPVLPRNNGGGVGLFVVAAQLGEHLVEGHAHGDGEPHLLPQAGADVIRQLSGVVAEQVQAAGDVQPALIDAEGLHQVGILPVDGVDTAGVLGVQSVVGRQQDQVRTLLLGLPHRLRRLDAPALGGLVLGQDDAVAGGGIAADGHRHLPQCRLVQQLHRGEKAVEVAVENDPIRHTLASSEWNVCSIITQASAFEKGLRHFIFSPCKCTEKSASPRERALFSCCLCFIPTSWCEHRHHPRRHRNRRRSRPNHHRRRWCRRRGA